MKESIMDAVTVVVPVFNAHDDLVACLASLDAHSPDARVIVIDDASDDPRIAPLLERWAGRHRHARVLTQPVNRGFVHSANLGVGATGDDVVLLNSDTVVTAGWLDALVRCLASDPCIATATPWSNNAEIVSLPIFGAPNPVPEDPESWAAAVRNCARGSHPELPTAVGFCMAVSRRCIDEIGFFNEAAFGHGYGEENDFCRRASVAGWRNVLCEDAFVVHRGGASFGPLGMKPGEDSMARLLALHPDYLEVVGAWIAADPLAERRRDIRAAWEQAASAKLAPGREQAQP
jgi:GT2 family glycosyltransferase